MLLTTLTKRMAEDEYDWLSHDGFKPLRTQPLGDVVSLITTLAKTNSALPVSILILLTGFINLLFWRLVIKSLKSAIPQDEWYSGEPVYIENYTVVTGKELHDSANSFWWDIEQIWFSQQFCLNVPLIIALLYRLTH